MSGSRERAWLRQVRANPHLFRTCPVSALALRQPLWRRAEAVRELLRGLRQAILSWAGEDVQPLRLLDSFPMPLCACYRIRQSNQPISGSSFAYNSSKKEYYFGLHPGLLLTENGYIDDLFLAPGYMADVDLLTAYLDECIEEGQDVSGQEWIMDKGFVSKPLKQAAAQSVRADAVGPPARLQRTLAAFFQHLLDKLRKPIEGVISGVDRKPEHRASAGTYRHRRVSAHSGQSDRFFAGALLQ